MTHQTLPDDPYPAQLTEIMAMVQMLGTAEIEFAGSLTTPLFWAMHDPLYGDKLQNGSLFFLDAGQGVFGVTAAHVVTACLQDAEDPAFRQCRVARHEATPFQINLRERVIALHEGMDIATLRFTAEEVKAINRTPLTGYQRIWPPTLAVSDSWVTYAGWPGVGRRWISNNDLRFGLVTMAGKVSSAHEACISVVIERDELQRVLGDRDMPEDFDFGGMSGGPCLRMVERAGLRGWVLAGVVFQGPNPSRDAAQSISGLEILRIRPAHFIHADGTLDVERWQHCTPPGQA